MNLGAIRRWRTAGYSLEHAAVDNPALRAVAKNVHDIDLKEKEFGRTEVAGVPLWDRGFSHRVDLVSGWAIVLRAISAAALTACMMAPALAVDGRPDIDFRENRIGLPPEKFDFAITGQGQPGRWTFVRDMTGVYGIALEQSSDDPTENRYPLAIYKGVSLRNLAVSVRLKVMKGTMQTAGIAFRFVDPENYYVINASALEQRVDLFRVVAGRIKRIGGTDANVVLNNWHELGVTAVDDQFMISFDNASRFTISDRTFLNHGYVGLWTEEDNVVRFEQLEIKSLPGSEDR